MTSFKDFYDNNSMTCSSEFSNVESNFVGRSLQHAITWRNITKSRQIVTLTSGETKTTKTKNIYVTFLGKYAACGFEIGLKRKHEPLLFQVHNFS